jgi:hypothetical protein
MREKKRMETKMPTGLFWKSCNKVVRVPAGHLQWHVDVWHAGIAVASDLVSNSAGDGFFFQK